VLSLLEDHRQCQVVLVTIPEETPVNEAVETAFSLEDRVGIGLGPIVVNGVYPPIEGLVVDEPAVAATADEADVSLRPGEAVALASAARFRLDRSALQAEQVARLHAQLPLPQLRLPFLFSAEIGPAELDELARVMLAEIDALAGLPQ
jgi:hypothetical protein